MAYRDQDSLGQDFTRMGELVFVPAPSWIEPMISPAIAPIIILAPRSGSQMPSFCDQARQSH